MSDFADLWNSTKPATSAPQPQKLGLISTASPRPGHSRPDAFSLLSASSPATSSRPITPKPRTPQPAVPTGDAFSSLFSLGNGIQQNQNLTMAERAAQAEQDRLKQQIPSLKKTETTAWTGLDMLGAAKSVSSDSLVDDWAFGAKPPTVAPAPADEDDWLSGFTSPPPPAMTTPAEDPWDAPVPRRRSSLELDGDSGGGLLSSQDDDDDILGDLAKPAPPSQPERRPTSNSPPPHILGQIVEMGFSPDQARIALAATDSGLDVQAALDYLLANGAGDSSPRPAPPRRPARDRPSRETPRDRELDTPSPPSNTGSPDILAQASDLTFSLLGRAAFAWKEGSKKVQKMYEETLAEGSASGPSSRPASGASGRREPNGRGGGRPKWMQQPPPEDDDDAKIGAGGFSDDPDPEPARPFHAPANSSSQRPPREEPEPEVDLFSAGPPSIPQSTAGGAYISKWRHASSSRSGTPSTASRPSVPRPSAPQRQIISATPTQLSTAVSHKTSGTSSFKLGQFSTAESHYTSAISSLPADHLLLIPLYNNRGLARLKGGDFKGAEDDTGVVIELVGNDSSVVEIQGVDERVNLSDALLKALKRRAQSLEGREKWELAGKDWERLVVLAQGGVRDEGVRGAGRCRRMLEPSSTATAITKKKPPIRKPAIDTRKADAAVSSLRQSNAAAEAEATLAHSLKDSIDSRLLVWKGGKEQNIRALLSSLDLVLWPEKLTEVGKIGMADLVQEKGVKKVYMRVIGRLHPDKLNTANSTVEQRMLANAVFGALNEAWNSFKG